VRRVFFLFLCLLIGLTGGCTGHSPGVAAESGYPNNAYADGVHPDTSPEIINPEASTGPPDQNYSEIPRNECGRFLLLDMGARNEGTGSLVLYYNPKSVRKNLEIKVAFLRYPRNPQNEIIFVQQVELTPDQNTVLIPYRAPDPETGYLIPYRYIALFSGEKTYQIDAVEAETFRPDSDLDGLSDTYEVFYGLDPFDPDGDHGPDGDPDGDGLTNLEEFTLDLIHPEMKGKTNPLSRDSDEDGLDDRWETENDLDPSDPGQTGRGGDPDNDKLPNYKEEELNLDPHDPDQDHDGLKDGWEILNGLVVDPADSNGDGLPDGRDSDQDGLLDGWEVSNGRWPEGPTFELREYQGAGGLDPLNPDGDDGPGGDPDQDGLTNLEELAAGTHPKTPDTDFDGVLDGEEIALGANPRLPDSDADGLPDGWEVSFELDPARQDGEFGKDGDPDGDGLPNIRECIEGLSPIDPDYDDDGLLDGWEVKNRFDPKVPDGEDGPDGDPDADLLRNLIEMEINTDPRHPDSDQDSLPDGWETLFGLNPMDPEGEDGPLGDPDDDGCINISELIQSSSPVVANPVCRINLPSD
jgi:hypothetical protein